MQSDVPPCCQQNCSWLFSKLLLIAKKFSHVHVLINNFGVDWLPAAAGN
jgi:hypothetical protein